MYTGGGAYVGGFWFGEAQEGGSVAGGGGEAQEGGGADSLAGVGVGVGSAPDVWPVESGWFGSSPAEASAAGSGNWSSAADGSDGVGSCGESGGFAMSCPSRDGYVWEKRVAALSLGPASILGIAASMASGFAGIAEVAL